MSPRGFKNGSNIGIEKITERLLDRAEYEIERYCLSIGLRFDTLASAYAVAATERFGALLPETRQWSHDQMPTLSIRTTTGMLQLPEVGASELALGDRETSQASREVHGHRGQKVKRGRGRPKTSDEERHAKQLERQRRWWKKNKAKVAAKKAKARAEAKKGSVKNYWAKMSLEERQAEMKRRMQMRGQSRAKQNQNHSADMKNYWASMTPAQRKAESDRRTKLRLASVQQKKAALPAA